MVVLLLLAPLLLIFQFVCVDVSCCCLNI
jgi:hypothetical protein